jgi:hypothetical protein
VSVQYSVTLRNSQLDLVESTTGAAALLRLYSGSVPANCAAAASGTLLCTITLPSDWMNAASAGAKTLLGTWSGTGDAGAGSGTAAGYFRVLDSSGVTTHLQGTVTVTGGGGDLTVDNTSIASAQLISISAFTITALNA